MCSGTFVESFVRRDGDELRIGALATLNEIGEHPLVTRTAGALASACLQAASAPSIASSVRSTKWPRR